MASVPPPRPRALPSAYQAGTPRPLLTLWAVPAPWAGVPGHVLPGDPRLQEEYDRHPHGPGLSGRGAATELG